MPGSAQHVVHGEVDSRACAAGGEESRRGSWGMQCPRVIICIDEEHDDGGAEVAVLPLQGNVWVV